MRRLDQEPSPWPPWPRWLTQLAGTLAVLTVLAVGCAKMDSAAPAAEPVATAQAAASGVYEVLVEEKEEADDDRSAEESAPAAPELPPAGLMLEGSGGGGTVEKVKAGKQGGFGKRQNRVVPEERKRMARRVVAKKTIAGAFMGASGGTKLFAEGGDGGEDAKGNIKAKSFGEDMDSDGRPVELAAAAMKDRRVRRGHASGERAEAPSDRFDDDMADEGGALDPPDDSRPDTFLPRMCYFENTYLGGNAAYLERLRRLDEAFSGNDRVYRQARSSIADVDAPEVHGLAVNATLSRRSFSRPGRVYLQVGLRGSQRYGWRRPPLDIAVVVDQPALANNRERVSEVLLRLVRDLGAQDRVIVHVVGGGPEPFLKPSPANQLRFRIAEKVDTLQAGEAVDASGLGHTMDAAGAALAKLSATTHRIPGAQIALLLVDGQRTERVGAARQAAHRLTLQGAVTSVLAVGARHEPTHHGWWQVANAGHGSYRLVEPGREDEAVRAELDALSRVVARLIRVNVRLGPHTQAIRIIGSKVLGQQEVKRVKAREQVVDQKLSETMGLEADRGDDDDGIQTVIPYFLGGDSHVMLIELWVDGPGHIADVELRYKDLVTLANATARASVALPRYGREDGAAERQVRQAVKSAEVAEVLKAATHSLKTGNTVEAANVLRQGQRRVDRGNAVLDQFATLLERNRHAKRKQKALLNDALEVARDRQMGDAGL